MAGDEMEKRHFNDSASKPATGIQRYTLIKNQHLTSLKAVEFGSLVRVRDTSNLEITDHAFFVGLLPVFRV